jgi:ABC-type multidrug transport system ATPase subunit
MEVLLRTLGLSRVADTLVGNNLIRGISGGERKRVTSAEMLVGPKVREHLVPVLDAAHFALLK